jgi:hypothetical protein
MDAGDCDHVALIKFITGQPVPWTECKPYHTPTEELACESHRLLLWQNLDRLLEWRREHGGGGKFH